MPLFTIKKRSGGNVYQAVGVFNKTRVRHSLGTSDYAMARKLCVDFEVGVLSGSIKLGATRSMSS